MKTNKGLKLALFKGGYSRAKLVFVTDNQELINLVIDNIGHDLRGEEIKRKLKGGEK